MFSNENSRTKLPYMHPIGYKVPIWKIIGKFIKEDLSKVSLPVQLNEPLNTLQKCCENLCNSEMLLKAAVSDDSCYRLAMSACYYITTMCLAVGRIKKPFNPILGETYELVNERFRFISEQVSHHPPISAIYT